MAMEKIKVELPTDDYYEAEVVCRNSCPVSTDARGYLMATVAGKYKEAYAISRATNPFASICGKVCGAPCEKGCRRSDVDEAVVIRNIKGYLTEKHGPEAGDLATPLTYSIAPGSVKPELNGKSIGIIGGGCAGYTCAHDLARLGYSVTVYERWETSGGQLVQGVPINRLSRKVVADELASIELFDNIEVKNGIDVGKDITFEELEKQHDAVYIAVGLARGRKIPIANSDHEDTHIGLEFLFDFNMREAWDLTTTRSIVIGGGDVAFDVARSALRCGSPEVQLACLERELLDEMTGSVDERDGGRREGVVINDGWGPREIVVENGKIKGLTVSKVIRVFDEDGKFSPQMEEETRLIEGDAVFFAVGQGSDLDFLENSGVELTPQGWVKVSDEETLATNKPNVFVGGDIAHGPKLFIDAVASGSKAAQGIHAYISGGKPQSLKRKLTFTDLPEYGRKSGYVDEERDEREELPVKPAEEPHVNSTVEYPEKEAKEQAGRCLECHIHPTFEGDICILCGGCVDVCPSYCLSMVTVDRVDGGEELKVLAEMEFGSMEVAEAEGSVMLFDPLKCIRCGMCAQKCPTGACQMTENSFEDCYA
ncbi:FAD-dependent oxidoreductase [Pontiella sulfatireligans]|uniref:NAD-dependent dihydropyrimidine dehydrogenase subunit PreT n=1 Tax=Pontiella sulfatireligans TaxID=2750658 RepID=A0A6C2UJD0_9BACT|nr:FAD-dependent oxidoreductase [Pontiella sulfatireligans]VGO19306.1 NAD-dependent dihydropyrimidine dehydrogenase subunit PreT [Pontiella sulfatireligans]